MEGYSSNSMIIVKNRNDLLQLTERDEEYLEIVDSSSEGSFIHFIESGELYMSTVWKSRLGLGYLTPKEACSMMLKNIHPDDDNRYSKTLLDAYNSKASKARLEFRFKLFDSSYIWLLGIIKIVYNEAGEPIKRYGINIDITEKKKQEEALKESEQLYKSLFENIEDAFVLAEPIYDEKGFLNNIKYLKVNDQYEKHTGLNAEHVVGRTAKEFLHDTETPWFAIHDKVLKTGKSAHFDNYIKATNRWYDVFCFPCFHGNLGILFRDITKKRLAEKALKETKELLDAVLQVQPTSVGAARAIRDSNGIIVDFEYILTNEMTQKLTPNYPSELNGMCFREVYPQIGRFGIIEKLSEVVEEGTALDFECNYEYLEKDEWLRINAVKFEDGVVIITERITERKIAEQQLLQAKEELARRAEDKYYKLFNSIDEGFCIVDMVFDASDKPVDYRVIDTNKDFDKYCGCLELKGKLISEITSDVNVYWADIFGKVALTGEPIRYESYVKLSDGWMSIYAFKLNQESNSKVAVLFKDISKDVRQRLELENSLHIQDQMFSNASHELRTPLNVLLGAIQLMESQDSGKKEKPVKLLRAMKQNCFRLIRLVNNIIDVSKIDSNNMNVNYRTCNIVSLVEDITVSIAAYAEMRGIDLIFDTNEEELMMSTDSDFIERIILNLLSNSLKFTDEKGQIQVVMQVNEKSVRISIKDTGEGIPEDKLAIIFHRYGQASKEICRRAEGTGIGLHLTKKLIDILEGTISVNSKLGEGTEFIIELPITHIEENKRDTMIQKSLAERISIEFSDIYKN